MTGFFLKISTKHGEEILKNLDPYSTVGMLNKEISKITKTPVNDLHIFYGLPLKRLELEDEQETLESKEIRSGDILMVLQKLSPLREEESFIKERLYQGSGNIVVLLKKVVPADNSCLFTSIRFALSGEVDTNCASFMRKIIAEAVAHDPETYNEGVLGQPNADYCEWIQQPTSWGGAIELAVLSKFYGIEIVVVDSVNGILNRFGEDQSYDYRIFLFFDGIHYDPLYLENLCDDGSIQFKTQFHISEQKMLQEAMDLAREAKASRQFVDTNRFILHCNECNIFIEGQREVVRHAKETGHTSFSEINTNN